MIYLGADHAGFGLKERLKSFLNEWGYQFQDLGNTKFDGGDDYPDFAKRVAEKVSRGKNKGILICSSGQGMVMTANKFKKIRACLGWSEKAVRLARQHNNANILYLRARELSLAQALKIVKIWLKTPFPRQPRHLRRIRKI